MTKKWCYVFAGVAAVAFGLSYVNDVQAKYVDKKTLTVVVNIEKHYEVAFDANGGSGSMTNQQFTSGVEQALSANEYVNSGYNFVGWNTSADGNGTAYVDEDVISADLTNVGGDVVTLYAQWETTGMHTVFSIDGTCVFHGYDIQRGVGEGYITGTNCSSQGIDWADGTHKYIDTGVKLYNSTNYEKDYEVGFTITAYDPDNQYIEPGDRDIQSTFFNSKLEDSSRNYPGIVIRKNGSNVEVTETITMPNGSHDRKTGNGSSANPIKVVITRTDGVVYYSFNGGAFTELQNINDTADYFDVTAWFGAAEKADGAPMRYIDATITDMYIKMGDKGTNKHVVSFDAGGLVENPSDVSIVSASKIGNRLPNMPNYVDTEEGRMYFIGWYADADGTGDKYTEDTIIDDDVTLYALWNSELVVCRVGSIMRGDLQSCINDAGVGDTVTLADNVKATNIAVTSGMDIILDLNGFKLSDNGTAGQPVIENTGKLTVINGTMTSALRAGVLNNNAGGELYIGSGARIIATGSRQAVYNKGGYLEINDGAYLSSKTSERAAVQSLNDTTGPNVVVGRVAIKGGTIVSEGQSAVVIDSGTLTIGIEDGVANNNTPILQGVKYGLSTSVDVSIYDGLLRGKTAAINATSRIVTTEAEAVPVGIDPVVTEVIDGVTYKILYYE